MPVPAYTEHVKEPGGALSSFFLYPCTIPRKTNCLLGASLGWATGSNNKYTEITKPTSDQTAYRLHV